MARRTLLVAGIGFAAAGVAGCSGAAPAEPGDPLAGVGEVPVGEARVVGGSEQPVVVARLADGNFVGHSAICTHGGCTVAVDGGMMLHCPCHGSEFDAATGAVRRGPASRPLPVVPVEVHGEQVVRG